MGAMTLLVDRRGATLSQAAPEVALIRYPDGTSHRIGLKALALILIVGEVSISTGLLRACLEKQINVLLFPGRGPGPATTLFPDLPRNAALRHRQHLCHADERRRLAIAKALVTLKIQLQQDGLLSQGQRAPLGSCLARTAEANNLSSGSVPGSGVRN